MQVVLVVVAIAGAKDLAGQAVLRLGQMGDLVVALKKEVVDVFGDEGMTRRSLFKLQLMDSLFEGVSEDESFGN